MWWHIFYVSNLFLLLNLFVLCLEFLLGLQSLWNLRIPCARSPLAMKIIILIIQAILNCVHFSSFLAFFSSDFIGSYILEYIVYDLMCTYMLSRFSHVQLFVTLRTIAQPGSSVHGILQARILKWVEMPSSRESSWSRDQTSISCIAGGFYTAEPLGKTFSSIQLLSHLRLFVTPWTAARQASLSITNSLSLLKFMSIKSVMPFNYLILCCPLLLLPSIFPSIRVFSNESVLHIRWPKYWSFSFSISPSNEYSGLISFRMDWLDLLAVQGTLKSLLQNQSSKASILWCSGFFVVQLSHLYMITEKTIALTRWILLAK